MIFNKNKLLVLLTVIIACLYVVIHLLNSNKKPTPANPTSSQTTTTPSPSATSNSARKPAETPVSAWGESATVNSQTSVSQAYLSLLGGLGTEKFTYLRLKDEKGSEITLDTLRQGLGIGLPPSLQSLLNDKSYYLFACSENGNIQQHGIVLFYGVDTDKRTTTSYQDMIQWEPTMLKDLHPLLFPSVSFSTDQLQQPLVFSEGAFREASFQLPDSTSGVITYSVVKGPIIISTSRDCLTKAEENFFDVDER